MDQELFDRVQQRPARREATEGLARIIYSLSGQPIGSLRANLQADQSVEGFSARSREEVVANPVPDTQPQKIASVFNHLRTG